MPRRRTARPSARRPAARPAPPPAPAPQQPQQGPGLFGQMAATAGGVAIGSAVGHALGNAFVGGKESTVDAVAPMEPQVLDQRATQALHKPCEFELQQFLECAKTNDLSLCEGFNQVLKECRTRYNI
uniref:CHCH domain-containing protein n=1 Tax=Trichuris muris TaxID=70415 RepID=A0A5S6QE61_TRIMR